MKHFTLLFIFAFLALSCNQKKSEPNKSDLELANLKGRVSRVQSTVFQVKNSVCPAANCGVSCKQTITSYNEKGKIMGTCCINDDGDTVMISKYVYDRRQRCKEIDKYSKDELAGREVNEFDGDNLSRVIVFNEYGEPENIYRYEYPRTGMSVGRILNSKSEILRSFKNFYVDGQVDSLQELDINGKVATITRHFRNENKDVVLSSIHYPERDEKVKFSFQYEYDGQHNWTQQKQIFNGDIVQIIVRNIFYYE